MESRIPKQTLTDDLVHQQDYLKEAVHLAIQRDTDMVIVSKDKKLIPCHSSLLALFSPVIARLLTGVPCCSPPTIFLPDFPAFPIKNLLHLLRSGQAIPGENVNVNIEMISRVAQVLEISMIDLNLGPYLENPLEVSFEMKKELNNFIVKEEINLNLGPYLENPLEVSFETKEELKNFIVEEEMYSFEEEKQDKVLHVKQKSDSYSEELKSIPVKGEEIKDMSLDDAVFSVNRKGRQVCSVCGKSFGKLFHLKEHMLIHSGERPFLCEHCPKKFTKKSHLKDHIRIHTGEKPFSCSICPKMFAQKSHLVEHIRIHTGEKPFSCLICPLKFTVSSHLKEHTRSIHTGEKPFQCLVCKKKFTQKSKLKVHNKECS